MIHLPWAVSRTNKTLVPAPYHNLMEPEESFPKLLPFALNFDEAQYGQPDLQGSRPALLHDLLTL